jgi:hypothetical protein
MAEFGIPSKLTNLTKTTLETTYDKVRIRNKLSGVRQGDSLSTVPF